MYHRKTAKYVLTSGTAVTALMFALGAAAQDADPGASSSAQEVVVTANKRPENVQNVATSVSVVSGAKLVEQGSTKLSDYLALVPGVSTNTFGGTPGQSIITIRGIAPLSAGSKVATYIDEAPLGSSGIWAQSFVLSLDLLPFDVDRIELLRGPQGTLYGATSMGGLLKYVLTTPDTHKYSGDISADVGAVAHADSAEGSIEARVNVPIVEDKLAVSASLFDVYTPGYVGDAARASKDTNLDREYGGRLALFWKPIEKLTVKLDALFQSNDSKNDSLVSYANPTEQASSPLGPRLVSGGAPFGTLTENKSFLEPFRGSDAFYSGTFDYNAGHVDLISATSWSRTTANRTNDSSLTYGTYLPLFHLPVGLAQTHTRLITDKFTQEFRIASPKDQTISWQAGVFYTNEDQTDQQTFLAFNTAGVPIPQLAPALGYASIPTNYKEYAVFGDVTWKLTDKVDLSGGLRYSKNDQVFNTSSEGALLGLPQTPLKSVPTVKSSDDDTTFSASARYHFTKDIMVYTRIASGYAPGGANTPGPNIPQATVQSETLTSYEVGLKSEFLDHRALVDVAAYHIDWKDIQLGATNGTVTFTTNGGDATSDGFELSSRYSPIDNLTFGFNAAYTDAQLTRLNADVASPFILHKQLEFVPKWSLAGTAEYSWILPKGWMARAGGDVHYLDKEAAVEEAYHTAYYILPSYTVIGLNASVTKDRLTFRVYAKNLADERGLSYAKAQTGVTGKISQIDYSVIQPRTIGVGVVANF